MKNILAIDPGSVESGYVVTDTANGMKIRQGRKQRIESQNR